MTPAEIERAIRARVVLEWVRDHHPHRITGATAALLQDLVELGGEHPSPVAALKALGYAQSSARWRLHKKQLPYLRAWHGLARGLRVAHYLRDHPHLSLTVAALDLGYSDHSYISHLLRRTFGLTASEIRALDSWEPLIGLWWYGQAQVAIPGGVR